MEEASMNQITIDELFKQIDDQLKKIKQQNGSNCSSQQQQDAILDFETGMHLLEIQFIGKNNVDFPIRLKQNRNPLLEPIQFNNILFKSIYEPSDLINKNIFLKDTKAVFEQIDRNFAMLQMSHIQKELNTTQIPSLVKSLYKLVMDTYFEETLYSRQISKNNFTINYKFNHLTGEMTDILHNSLIDVKHKQYKVETYRETGKQGNPLPISQKQENVQVQTKEKQQRQKAVTSQDAKTQSDDFGNFTDIDNELNQMFARSANIMNELNQRQQMLQNEQNVFGQNASFILQQERIEKILNLTEDESLVKQQQQQQQQSTQKQQISIHKDVDYRNVVDELVAFGLSKFEESGTSNLQQFSGKDKNENFQTIKKKKQNAHNKDNDNLNALEDFLNLSSSSDFSKPSGEASDDEEYQMQLKMVTNQSPVEVRDEKQKIEQKIAQEEFNGFPQEQQLFQETDIMQKDMIENLVQEELQKQQKDIENNSTQQNQVLETQQQNPFAIQQNIQSLSVNKQQSGNSKDGRYQFAQEDTTPLNDFYYVLPLESFALHYKFELDDFQKRAILRLEKKESIFVAAHTSAGKTAVADYAIALSIRHRTRAIYTSPIKALSNQKYREFIEKFKDVGIITGDVSIKQDALCLIMTTEILRNMLYKGSDLIRDIEWVIFDEVHYVSNQDRGGVWEETIILLPQHIGIIMLSASVPNSMEFADWVGRTKNRKIYVMSTLTRPVPLEHNIYVLNKFHLIKECHGAFLQQEYSHLYKNIEKVNEEKLKSIQETKQQKKDLKFDIGHFKQKDLSKQGLMQKIKDAKKKFIQHVSHDDLGQYNRHDDDKRAIVELIRQSQAKNLLPCVVFTFSKLKINELVLEASHNSLLTKPEQDKVRFFFSQSLKKLKPKDRTLPQLVALKYYLERGYATHHGDLLPICKEMVEILFSENLVKVLFATETFAMGINMPAKTVIFHQIMKNDGQNYRYLRASEYTQMSGRAGRRGIDDSGHVVIYFNNPRSLPSPQELKSIVDFQGEPLLSQFKMSYALILNLLTCRDLNVMQMMQRSFGENNKFRTMSLHVLQQKRLKAEYKQIRNYKCIQIEATDIESADYQNGLPLFAFLNNMQLWQKACENVFSSGVLLGKLNPLPKFALLFDSNAHFQLAIILKVNDNNQNQNQRNFVVLLVEEAGGNKDKRVQLVYEAQQSGHGYNVQNSNSKQLKCNPLFRYRVTHASSAEIVEIYFDKLQVAYQIQQSEMTSNPRYLNDMGALLYHKQQQVLEKQKDNILEVCQQKGIFQRMQFHNKDEKQMKDSMQNKHELQTLVLTSPCFSCPELNQHRAQQARKEAIQNELQKCLHLTDQNDLHLLDTFEGRLQVLAKLNYVDHNQLPLMKAKIAKEMPDNDVYMCEVLLDNILDSLTEPEIAALLSGFVCQQNIRDYNYEMEDLPEELFIAIDLTKSCIYRVALVEQEFGVLDEQTPQEVVKKRLNFNLAKVIYEWASQMDFFQVCLMTQAQEGAIVRCIQRLEILLRDVKNSMRILGNLQMYEKLEHVQFLIKRDIVFTNSLYLD